MNQMILSDVRHNVWISGEVPMIFKVFNQTAAVLLCLAFTGQCGGEDENEKKQNCVYSDELMKDLWCH